MRIKIVLAFIFLLLFFSPSFADEKEIFSAPGELLGIDFSQSMEILGSLSKIYPLRGTGAWQDDVVFFYENHIYLYWYNDRVWQVRWDSYAASSFMGIDPGSSSFEISGILELQPSSKGADWEIYFLKELPHPLRLRFFYDEDKAVDFYLYRGAF